MSALIKRRRFTVDDYHYGEVSDLNAGCVYCHSERHENSYRLVRQFKKGEFITPGLLPECSIPVENLLP